MIRRAIPGVGSTITGEFRGEPFEFSHDWYYDDTGVELVYNLVGGSLGRRFSLSEHLPAEEAYADPGDGWPRVKEYSREMLSNKGARDMWEGWMISLAATSSPKEDDTVKLDPAVVEEIVRDVAEPIFDALMESATDVREQIALETAMGMMRQWARADTPDIRAVSDSSISGVVSSFHLRRHTFVSPVDMFFLQDGGVFVIASDHSDELLAKRLTSRGYSGAEPEFNFGGLLYRTADIDLLEALFSEFVERNERTFGGAKDTREAVTGFCAAVQAGVPEQVAVPLVARLKFTV